MYLLEFTVPFKEVQYNCYNGRTFFRTTTTGSGLCFELNFNLSNNIVG